jgi:hypothetical protein
MGRSIIGPLRMEIGTSSDGGKKYRQADRERIFKIASLTGQIEAAKKRGNTATVERLTTERNKTVAQVRKRISNTDFAGALPMALNPRNAGSIRRDLAEIERRAKLGGPANQNYGKLVPGGNAASNRARGITR